MKRFNLILFVVLLLLWGCEKIIDVDLNDANPVVVIEGILSKNPNSVEVKISKTKSYFDSEPAQMVSGATVSISNGNNLIYELFETEKGVYKPDKMEPHLDIEYKLTVEVEGRIYESVSKLNDVVNIDSLVVEYNEGNSFLDSGYNVNMLFHDSPGMKNFYQLKIFVNSELEDDADDLILFDDENTDGKFVELRMRRKLYKTGDTVKYELISLDEAAYNYLDAISEIIGEGSAGTAAPANPNPNFTNGALGYFSAYSSNQKTIVVKE